MFKTTHFKIQCVTFDGMYRHYDIVYVLFFSVKVSDKNVNGFAECGNVMLFKELTKRK